MRLILLGFLASVNNPDIYFKYCGYTFGLRHCLREVYKRNPDTYFELVETINPGIIKLSRSAGLLEWL